MKAILTLLFFVFSGFVFSQNTVRYSQFNFAKSLYNPAALASDAKFTADLLYRNQWAGVDGAPSTVGFNTAFEVTNEMAVGINFYTDRIGLNQTTSFSAQYAYRLVFDTRKYLAFGIGIGADNLSYGYANATTGTANDPAFSQSYSKFNLNGSFGMYYRSSNFYIGASLPQLFQNKVGYGKQFSPPYWHYMLVSGYFFEVSDNFVLNPNIQLKGTANAPIQGDLLLRGITNSLGFSIGYRSENSLIAGIDYTISGRVRIGYAFNHDVGSLARTKGASHEVYLGLGLPYYFNRDSFDSRKYVGRKGGHKTDFRRSYKRYNRRN